LLRSIELGAQRAAVLGRLATNRAIHAAQQANIQIRTGLNAARNYHQPPPPPTPLLRPNIIYPPRQRPRADTSPISRTSSFEMVPNHRHGGSLDAVPHQLPGSPLQPRSVASFPDGSPTLPRRATVTRSLPNLPVPHSQLSENGVGVGIGRGRSPSIGSLDSAISRLTDIEVAAFKARGVDFVKQTGKLLLQGGIFSVGGYGLLEIVNAVRGDTDVDVEYLSEIMKHALQASMNETEIDEKQEQDDYIKANSDKFSEAERTYWENRAVNDKVFQDTLNADFEADRKLWIEQNAAESFVNKTLHSLIDQMANLTIIVLSNQAQANTTTTTTTPKPCTGFCPQTPTALPFIGSDSSAHSKGNRLQSQYLPKCWICYLLAIGICLHTF